MKWRYIRLISEADRVLELLDRYDKNSTQEITEDEAREFALENGLAEEG